MACISDWIRPCSSVFGTHRIQPHLGHRYAAIGVLFAAGETQRRDKLPRLPQLKPAQVPLFVIGVVLFVIWFALFRFEILANLENILADPIPVLAGATAIPIVAFTLVKYYTRGGRKAIV